MTTDPALLSMEDAARRLGIGVHTAYDWAHADDAPDFFIRVGRRWKVSAIRLHRYLHGASA